MFRTDVEKQFENNMSSRHNKLFENLFRIDTEDARLLSNPPHKR